MKLKLTILSLLACCFVLMPLGIITGCGTPATTAFKSEKTADITVSAAMTAWGDYVKANHPPVAQELQVKALFEKYQATQLLLIDATKALADAAASTNSAGVTSSQSAITTLAGQLSVNLSDLVALLQSFGVSIK